MSMAAALDAERLKDLSVYEFSGSRFYGHWQGLPRDREGCTIVFRWLRSLFFGCASMTVAELHPNGGIWTHSILDLLSHTCVPTFLTYHVLGEGVEQVLVMRDAIRVFDPYAKWDHVSRVRKYPRGSVPKMDDPTLISECLFLRSGPRGLPENLDAIFCFDTLHCLGKHERYHTYMRISKALKEGGTFIGSCSFYEKDYDISVMEEHGLMLDTQWTVSKGHYYFRGVKG
jgi:hypothetical protein